MTAFADLAYTRLRIPWVQAGPLGFAVAEIHSPECVRLAMDVGTFDFTVIGVVGWIKAALQLTSFLWHCEVSMLT